MLEFIFASGAESKKGKNNNNGNGSVGEKDLGDRQHSGGRGGSKVPPRDGFEEHSPTQVASRYGAAAGADPLPLPFPVALFHGTSDVTCPAEQSERFHAALLSAVDSGIGQGRGDGDGGAAGATAPAVATAVTRAGTSRVSLRLFEGLSHTDPIIECPFGGGEGELSRHYSIAQCVTSSHVLCCLMLCERPGPPSIRRRSPPLRNRDCGKGHGSLCLCPRGKRRRRKK